MSDDPPTSYSTSDDTSVFLSNLFATLIANKGLPKYQFERRIDVFLTSFLPDILAQRFGWDVQLVVPEFPIKKLDNNQSTNVDHLLFRRALQPADERWLFFELKTDVLSVRDPQVVIYLQAMQSGMQTLSKGLQEILKATRFREKYKTLAGRIDSSQLDRPIELVYLAPSKVSFDAALRAVYADSAERSQAAQAIHQLTFDELRELELPQYPAAWKLFRSQVLDKLI